MFRIKICGITNIADAQAAAAAGADAIGLNFFTKSRRFVEPATAQRIATALPADVLKVGVFVNHSASEIVAIANQVGLNAVQLHGDERASIVAQLPSDWRVMRAHRCGDDGLLSLSRWLDECRVVQRMPDAVLIDANAGPEFGGTGQRADWDRVANERDLVGEIPLILAGGLTPENVDAAIRKVRPSGVDVASGVEHQPGVKDHSLVIQFIAAAMLAFSDDE